MQYFVILKIFLNFAHTIGYVQKLSEYVNI